jgi:OOP family OmpA-OmpF porin
MTKIIRSVMAIFLAVFLIGGLVQESQAVEPITTSDVVKNVYKVENLVRIADNVIVLFDSSGSMGEPYGNSGMTKLQAAKRLLKQRTDAFPGDYSDLNVGLYSYTPPVNTVANDANSVFYKVQPFNKAAFQEAVDKLPNEASGPTLMVSGMRRLAKVMENLSGRTVVFMFTDGSHSDDGASESPLELAKQIAKKHDIDFQLISTTDIETNFKLMQAVASINEASRVHSFESLLDRPEVFMGSVFALEESYVITATTRDKIVGFKLDQIEFGFDKSDIEIEFTMELDTVGEILNQNPDSYIVLAGHTDNIGAEEYNLALSHQRVEAVANYLAKEFQIDLSRVSMFWYGETAPIASNDTEEGRQKNRRVVGFISGIN